LERAEVKRADMRSSLAATVLLAAFVGSALTGPAAAADCPGNPTALGVSRTIVLDPREHPRLGTLQYEESLPLNDHEVVLTFDDGPLPPYTTRVLDVLASECVKATFFMVGRMVLGYPQLVRRAYNEGHTIADHSQNHPLTFNRMSIDRASKEIEDGFTSLRTALGDPNAVAPFFRIPGLLRQPSVENYLQARGVAVWSLDFLADDWKHINAREVARRALERIEARGRGILLLHDIQPATALALPEILKALKERGYKIVQVVPATADRPKTVTEPEAWVQRHPVREPWPRVLLSGIDAGPPALDVPSLQSFGAADAQGAMVPVELARSRFEPPAGAGIPLPPSALWPRDLTYSLPPDVEALPAPAAQNFRYLRVSRVSAFAARKPSGKPGGKMAATVKPVRAKLQLPNREPRPAENDRASLSRERGLIARTLAASAAPSRVAEACRSRERT
jgi:peptidoglycan/xylan/chitin deacetylase (PgdA/CDA1 family)